MKKLIKSLSAALTAVCGLLMTAVTVLSGQMPEQFSVVEGSCLHLDGAVSVQETIGSNGESAEVAALNAGSTYTANLKLFGLFPVKQVTVRVVEQEMVIPCGTPFGIMYRLHARHASAAGPRAYKTKAGMRRRAATSLPAAPYTLIIYRHDAKRLIFRQVAKGGLSACKRWPFRA